MSHKGSCTSGAGSCRLHQCGVNNGTQQATKHQEHPCYHGSFHVLCLGCHDERPDGKAKTMAKVLYERFIMVFGAPAKLLSDQEVNLTLALVEELCVVFGIQKCQTTMYHPQCNRQVECFHQTLFRMIGKLASDKKAQWEQHLPELLQVYNSMRSAITSYSPNYLMFGRCPHLPVDFFFPTTGVHVHSHRVLTYVEEVRK